MRDETVARNYAETLFELARKHDQIEAYGEEVNVVAHLLEENQRFRAFLATPRIADADKKAVVRRVLGDALPAHIVNFVMVTIDKRRQRLLGDITQQYHALLDAYMGREHVEVSVARPLGAEGTQMVAARLSKVLGKQAIPHVRVRPEILGGIVVRTGDTIYDGSVRRRMESMRRRLLRAQLPHGTVA